jgi:acetone carboxylase gamma subunit
MTREAPSYLKEFLEDLIDGKLDAKRIKEVMVRPKDPDRFEKLIEVLQGRVPWEEKILLPLSDRLFIVQKGKERIVKCSCGYELGDYKQNWKHKCLIYVRDTVEKLEELYPGFSHPDPEWMELREYICPGCGAILETEPVPPGYPALFEFEPDLETFYNDWLGKPLP